MNQTGFTEGNKLRLLCSGSAFFPALERAIDAATSEIHLETYIFKDDLIGHRIAAALIRAARRGVSVYLLIDGYGSYHLPGIFIQNLLNANIKLLIYRREDFFFRFRRYRLRRLHRKLAVIDARVAFVGGINIVSDYDHPHERIPRLDYAVLIEGPVLEKIDYAARHLWMIVAWAHFRKRWVNKKKWAISLTPKGNQPAGFLIRDNLRHRHDIEHAYLDAINQANTEIIIANAYFLPGRHFCNALNKAARRGVNVILLLQGKIEYRLQHYATHALYGNLLDAGIKIYEYNRNYLHAKVAVIDRYWSTVGSSNIDPFSLMLAREANLVIMDKAFAHQLRTNLMQAITQESTPVIRFHWRSQSWWYHALYRFCYFVIYYAQSILGYGYKEMQHHNVL
ncbi:MAG: cardiolipin synthase ClsB [Nitrosomonas sp.]|nr:cardiolipin synthase ClsB [Nitrosomonas sp.]MCW5607627.1 cardiolipin synthase ClsB [Nitrosomonas sp.]